MNASENGFLLLAPQGSALLATVDLSWVFASYVFSAVSALAAVNAVEAFRTERNATRRHLGLGLFSICIGGGSIWFLHFTGMYALRLEVEVGGVRHQVTQRYDPVLTIISYVAALVFVQIGAVMASKDTFFGSSKSEATTALQQIVSLKAMVKYGKRIKFFVLFTKPQRFIAGGSLTGLGVLSMHFIGMSALVENGFVMEWNVPVLATSFLLAMVVPIVGFWIVFRLLQWRPKNEALRVGSALVIALAVSGVHYSGMAACTYKVSHEHILDQQDATQPTSREVFTIGVFLNVSLVLGIQMYLLADSRRRFREDAVNITNDIVAAVRSQLDQAQNLDDAKTRFQKHIAKVLCKSTGNRNSVADSSAPGLFSFSNFLSAGKRRVAPDKSASGTRGSLGSVTGTRGSVGAFGDTPMRDMVVSEHKPLSN